MKKFIVSFGIVALFVPFVALAQAAPVNGEWINVRSAVGTCAAASGNGTTDDTVAIQCHLNYMHSAYGGGIVYFPAGNYLVSGGGLTLRGGVEIFGAGKNVTAIRVASNSPVVTFEAATCNHSSLRDVAIYGYQNPSATQSAVTIGNNCAVIIRDAIIWYGYAGINNNGIDSLIMNTSIFGFHAAVISQGANWYINDTLNTVGTYSSTYGFYQGVPYTTGGGAGGIRENHFVQTDFSGNYTYSIAIMDSTNNAYTVFDASKMTSPILVQGARWTAFINSRIDSTLSGNGGVITRTGSYSTPAPFPIGIATPQVPAGGSTAGAWTSVKAPVGSCSLAVGNNSTDDTAAIQCHIDYIYTTHGSGVVFFPPGGYRVSGPGLIVKGGVQLIGAGQMPTTISVATDAPVITFDAATCNRPSMSDMFIVGYQNPLATRDTVTVGNNCAATIRDTMIWFGRNALVNRGVGGVVENSFITGYNAGVLSQGSNWYIRDKLDSAGFHSTYSYFQGTPIPGQTSTENHLVQNDFSGDFTYSIAIEDSTNSATTVFDGAVISSPIRIHGARSTTFNNAEVGHQSFSVNNAGTISVVGSYAFGPMTIGGALTTVTGNNNHNITLNSQPPPPPPPLTINFSVSPTSVVSGGSSAVMYDVRNIPAGTLCSIGPSNRLLNDATPSYQNNAAVGSWVGQYPTKPLATTTTFTLACGSESRTAIVTVGTAPPPGTIAIGDRVRATIVLNVRSTPMVVWGNIIGKQQTNTLGTVVGGPVTSPASTAAPEYVWWNVNWDSGADGWSIQDHLQKVTAPPPPPLSCTLDGVTIASGQSGTFYSVRSVVAPAVCSSIAQNRTCTNGTLSGSASFQYATCTQTQPPPQQLPIVSITANGQETLSIVQGANYTLAWSSSNATSCVITENRTDGHPNGTTPIPPNTASSGQSGLLGSYTFTCINSAGSASDSVTITLAVTPPPPPPTPKTVYITSGSSWTVPSDWNSTHNSIEIIGGGGGGSSAVFNQYPGRGGGGGAYAKITNLALASGESVAYGVGIGGAGGPVAASGGDSWFNGDSCSGSSACGKGGGGAANAVGIGGSAAASVGTTKYQGGSGGHNNGGDGAGGAGGAGGPRGAGAHAGNGGAAQHGAGGGGGNGVGGLGAGGSNTNGAGGIGGSAENGTAGGAGGVSPSGNAAAGSQGSGGGGGGGGQVNGQHGGRGGNGGSGVEWDATHGSGSGGGGGGAGHSGNVNGGAGGNGGFFGGGGGGGGYYRGTGAPGAGGSGASGIIVITYTPAPITSRGFISQFASVLAAFQRLLQAL